MINLHIGCGSTIEGSIAAAKDTASVMKDSVQFQFNARTIIVRGDSDVYLLCREFGQSKVGDIVGPNTKAQQQSAASWLEAAGH